MKRRSLKQDKLAQVYDTEILPIWAERFGRMLLAEARIPKKGLVLNVACGTGYPAIELLDRMEGGRIIAIDSSSALLDVAREKAGDRSGKRIFFRTEGGKEKLSFDSEVYDLTFSNLGLDEMEGAPAQAVAELARVTAPGGQLLVTLPLRGTWSEFLDIFREVLTKHDRHDTLEALSEYEATLPEPEVALKWMEDAGLARVDLVVDEFSLLFKSSREFFFAPVIEFGPLGDWKRLVGKGQEMQDIFWFIKEAIDAYFGGRAFGVTVVAGCLSGFKPTEEERGAVVAAAAASGPSPEAVITTPGDVVAPRNAATPPEEARAPAVVSVGAGQSAMPSGPAEGSPSLPDENPAAELAAHLRDSPESVSGLRDALDELDGSYVDGFEDDEDTMGMAAPLPRSAKRKHEPAPDIDAVRPGSPPRGGPDALDVMTTNPSLDDSALPTLGPEEISIHELAEEDLEVLDEEVDEDALPSAPPSPLGDEVDTNVKNVVDLPDHLQKAIRDQQDEEPPKPRGA